MGTPSNNDFSNATVIGGMFGNLTGSNVSASAETGEPSNHGHTVWYRYDNFNSLKNPDATSSVLYFTTRNTGSYNDIPDPFNSRIQIFTASHVTASINQLTESIYLPYAGWTSRYAYSDIGGYVATTLDATGSVWIRVEGVSANDTGSFPLMWGTFYNQYIGDCQQCQPEFDLGLVCVATASFAGHDVRFGGFTSSFGSFPQGTYKIKYCGGALSINKFVSAGWCIFYDIGGRNGSILNFGYNSGSRQFIDPSFPANVDRDGTKIHSIFASQAEAENSFRCAKADFVHTGGTIDMQWYDTPIAADNINGNPNPHFGLYRLVPNISASTVCAVWNPGVNLAAVTYSLVNNNSNAWDKVRVSLEANGGVSSPSAAQTMSFAANSTVNAAFTFTTPVTEVTTTLKLEHDTWDNPIEIPWYVGAMPILTVSPPAVAACFDQSYMYTVTLRSVGYWKIQPDVVVTMQDGYRLRDPNGLCANTSIVTYHLPQFACGDDSKTFLVHIPRPHVDCSGTVPFGLRCGSGSYDGVMHLQVRQGGIAYGNHDISVHVDPI
jgi:hypothetical protein